MGYVYIRMCRDCSIWYHIVKLRGKIYGIYGRIKRA